MQYQMRPIGSIFPNPKNPRQVKDERFRKLVQSLREFPQMLSMRPIIVNPEGMILAGNQRYQAARQIGLAEVPVIEAALTEEQERELVIKDNVHAGEFAFASFFDNHDDWDVHDLVGWGVDLPFLPKEDPTADTRQVRDADIIEAEDRLRDKFGDRAGKREMTCPHCAKDFYVND
jgi:hypothetical protein